MRLLALLGVLLSAVGCTQPPTWEGVGNFVLYNGANVLASATGGRTAGDVYTDTNTFASTTGGRRATGAYSGPFR